MNVLIVIPALDPDEKILIEYVRELKEKGLEHILIIDDGSNANKQSLFRELEEKEHCIVLRHAVNMGKGRALKDAFNYYLTHFSLDDSGVITVDSDGQHTVEDVIKVKKVLADHPESLILGVRDFSQNNVPPKSAFGNKVTKDIIRLLYGGSITDTQTGLRGISSAILPTFLTLFGERFEYETGMLIEALRNKLSIFEVSIETVYYEGNKETHFHPLTDSWKIYKLILGTFLKYSLSSLSASLVDLGIFQLFIFALSDFSLGNKIWISTVIARVISSIYNYLINRNIVFKKNSKEASLIKYYVLCICQMCASALLVYIFCSIIELPKLIPKIIVDSLLFLISFRIQQEWVFGR